jgi:sporulation protein YlmC with PRC-barrel domain
MKVSEFLGTRVLDKNAVEIGKISDMYINPIEGRIKILTISTGEFGIRKKDIEINPDEIAVLGDYMILNIEKADLDVV